MVLALLAVLVLGVAVILAVLLGYYQYTSLRHSIGECFVFFYHIIMIKIFIMNNVKIFL